MDLSQTKTSGDDKQFAQVSGCAQHFSAEIAAVMPKAENIGTFVFDVSDNEEHIVLSTVVDGNEVLVNTECCHYMLLLLARARMIDQVTRLDDSKLGWLSINQFLFLLGCKQQVFYQHLLRFAQPWQQQVPTNSGCCETVLMPAIIELNNESIRFLYDDIEINCSQWCL